MILGGGVAVCLLLSAHRAVIFAIAQLSVVDDVMSAHNRRGEYGRRLSVTHREASGPRAESGTNDWLPFETCAMPVQCGLVISGTV